MTPRRIITQVIFLIVGLISLYLLLPQIVDVFAQAPNLGNVKWRWFFLMFVLMSFAFMSAWQLTRIAVPGVSLFVAGTAQLTSNAVSRVVPGGAVVGGGIYYQMLSVSGRLKIADGLRWMQHGMVNVLGNRFGHCAKCRVARIGIQGSGFRDRKTVKSSFDVRCSVFPSYHSPTHHSLFPQLPANSSRQLIDLLNPLRPV